MKQFNHHIQIVRKYTDYDVRRAYTSTVSRLAFARKMKNISHSIQK